jgi:hypothetical protein
VAVVVSTSEKLTWSDYVMMSRVPQPQEQQHAIGIPRLAAILCKIDPERIRGYEYLGGGMWEVDLAEATNVEQELYAESIQRAALALGYGDHFSCEVTAWND